MIALVQMKLTQNCDASFIAHCRYVEDIAADLIIFPECSLSGYDQNDFRSLREDDFQRALKTKIKELNAKCEKQNKLAVIGAPLFLKGALYNCAVLLGAGEFEKNIYKKRSLTEAESGIFSPGEHGRVIEVCGEKVGLLICRDQSTSAYFQSYAKQGVRKVIIQAAHYYELMEARWKKHKNFAIPVARAVDFGMDIYKVNVVGELGGFWALGGSLAASSSGRILGQLGERSEEVLFVQ